MSFRGLLMSEFITGSFWYLSRSLTSILGLGRSIDIMLYASRPLSLLSLFCLDILSCWFNECTDRNFSRLDVISDILVRLDDSIILYY